MTHDWRTHARRGASLIDARDYAAAKVAFEDAVAAGGATWHLWADLAIATKRTGDFERSFDAATRSIAAGAPPEDGVSWNYGVAATALGRWEEARSAWRRCGVRIPDGEGEIRADFGLTPIRLEPRKDKEIVWGWRICPARVVVQSIPIAVPERRHGDVLLHDGEPTGKLHDQDDEECSVFDELALLAPSRRRTYLARVFAPSPASVADLFACLAVDGHVGEDWTGERARHCPRCAAGVQHTHLEEPWTAERAIGIAAEQDPGPSLDLWLGGGGDGRRVRSLAE